MTDLIADKTRRMTYFSTMISSSVLADVTTYDMVNEVHRATEAAEWPRAGILSLTSEFLN